MVDTHRLPLPDLMGMIVLKEKASCIKAHLIHYKWTIDIQT